MVLRYKILTLITMEFRREKMAFNKYVDTTYKGYKIESLEKVAYLDKDNIAIYFKVEITYNGKKEALRLLDCIDYENLTADSLTNRLPFNLDLEFNN